MWRIRTHAVIVTTALTALLALPALAASLGSTSRTLSAGATAVQRCDPDGFAVALELAGTNVIGVTVSGLDAACGGLTVKATVVGSTTSYGNATVPGGGGTTTVTLGAAVAVAQSLRVDVVVAP